MKQSTRRKQRVATPPRSVQASNSTDPGSSVGPPSPSALGDCILVTLDGKQRWARRRHLVLSDVAKQRLVVNSAGSLTGVGAVGWCENDRASRRCPAALKGKCPFAHVAAAMRTAYMQLASGAPPPGRADPVAGIDTAKEGGGCGAPLSPLSPSTPLNKIDHDATPLTPPPTRPTAVSKSTARRSPAPARAHTPTVAPIAPSPKAVPKMDTPSISGMTRTDAVRLLAAVDAYDTRLAAATRETGHIDPAALGKLALHPDETALLQCAYTNMLHAFDAVCYREQYGCCDEECEDDEQLVPGGPVPSYFANVHDQSIHRRKVLSIAGLRNLAEKGPEIYQELAARHFGGRPQEYGPMEGINKMRHFTGQVVDLDTTVLRASDPTTLAAVNAMNRHKGEPEWSDGHTFGSSEQAADIAAAAAAELCDRFADDLKLTKEQRKTRKVESGEIQRPIPMATHNTHRGMWPVWHYVNVGQDSFHANVPTMSDVVGALLKAPFHCVRLWVALHIAHSADAVELKHRVDSFFEDAVADSCFNMKWKAIEEFSERLAREGSIIDVLQRLQQQHQTVFAAIFDTDDAECSAEKAKMWTLAEGSIARDKTGRLRAITHDDVVQWVNDPAVVL